MIFNVFGMMTLFNLLNSRKLNNVRNVFDGIFANTTFMIVVLVTFALHFSAIQFGGVAFDTMPTSAFDWAICIAFGCGSLVWHEIILCFPYRWIPGRQRRRCSWNGGEWYAPVEHHAIFITTQFHGIYRCNWDSLDVT